MSYEDEQEPEGMYDDDTDGSLNFDEPPAQRREDRMVRKQSGVHRNIEKVYLDYLADIEGAEGNLFGAVGEFFSQKIDWRMRDVSNGEMVAADDVAQDLTLYVWQHIDEVKSAGTFVPWLKQIAFRNGSRAAGEAKDESMTKVPLQVEDEIKNGDVFMKDNPLIKRKSQRATRNPIPESIQGLDRTICEYVWYGLSYKQIGLENGMTENAVELRVRKIRARLKAGKA